jgi:hypothetical protein
MKLCFISSSMGLGRIRSREFGAVMATHGWSEYRGNTNRRNIAVAELK